MKPTFINIRVLGTTALALLFATSCSDILDEQPRSIYGKYSINSPFHSKNVMLLL